MTNNKNLIEYKRISKMGILSNLFSKDKEILELREMIATLNKQQAKLYAEVDSMKEEINQLKEINAKLISIIVTSSEFGNMRTKVRLSKFSLPLITRLFPDIVLPPRKP